MHPVGGLQYSFVQSYGAAEAAASRAAQEITTRALEAIGARAASSRHGFDRFWRNARTYTLREPVSDRLREVGTTSSTVRTLRSLSPPDRVPIR